MSSLPANQTSGSDEDPQLAMDPRKRKRMISNRESARRSRMRKQQHLEDLINQIAQLKMENVQIAMQIDALTQQFGKVESENAALRSQVMALTERLQHLNSVLLFVEEFSGMPMDIPEIPDPLLKPWQLPCPAQPIMASANLFHC